MKELTVKKNIKHSRGIVDYNYERALCVFMFDSVSYVCFCCVLVFLALAYSWVFLLQRTPNDFADSSYIVAVLLIKL